LRKQKYFTEACTRREKNTKSLLNANTTKREREASRWRETLVWAWSLFLLGRNETCRLNESLSCGERRKNAADAKYKSQSKRGKETRLVVHEERENTLVQIISRRIGEREMRMLVINEEEYAAGPPLGNLLLRKMRLSFG
jgi:hypothetical protein